MRNKKYEIVSLGCNCIPRTIMTRQKVKPSKKEGELSCPFDLVVHKAKRVTHYIKTDFENYFEDLTFKPYKRYWWDFRNMGLWHKSDDTYFFHDKDCKKNDKEKLIGRVSKRIENFRQIIHSDLPVIFVQYLMEDEDIENLYTELSNIRGNKTFEMVIFDFNNVLTKNYPNMHILKIPFPSEIYKKDWNRKRCFNSKEGKAFEKTIKDFLLDILKKYE